jgi:hypothetical protein
MYLDVGLRLYNHYVIQKVLGQAGFGITYLANDQLLFLIVAFKEYLPRQLAARGDQESQVVVFSGQAGEHYAYVPLINKPAKLMVFHVFMA